MDQTDYGEDYRNRRAEFEKAREDTKQQQQPDRSAQTERIRKIVDQQLERARLAEESKVPVSGAEVVQEGDDEQQGDGTGFVPSEFSNGDPGLIPTNFKLQADLDSLLGGTYNRVKLHAGKIKVFDGSGTVITVDVDEQVLTIPVGETSYIQLKIELTYYYGYLTGASLLEVSYASTLQTDDTITIDCDTSTTFTVYYDIGVVTADVISEKACLDTIQNYVIGNGVLPVPGPATQSVEIITDIRQVETYPTSGSSNASASTLEYQIVEAEVMCKGSAGTGSANQWYRLQDDAVTPVDAKAWIHAPQEEGLANGDYLLRYEDDGANDPFNWTDITSKTGTSFVMGTAASHDVETSNTGKLTLGVRDLELPSFLFSLGAVGDNTDIDVTTCP